MPTRRTRFLALNDPRLAAYLVAADETERARQLELLLTREVQPRVHEVLQTYVRNDWPMGPYDVDDIVGQVTLRVLRKLRAATVMEEESVQNIEAYVTTLTKNAVRDFMRRRSPERTRLKSRLRYLFTHDARLALWNSEGVTFCGLSQRRQTSEAEQDFDVVRKALGAIHTAAVPTEEVVSALRAIGKPVRLADLVSVLVTAEPVIDRHSAPSAIERVTPQRDLFEIRQYLQVLWREVRDLPARQRAALLLNLREPGSGNAALLFVSLGIATLEELAEAVEMTVAELRSIWDDLPFDDQRIAAHLGLRRQQVINLRKSARERLGRRMANRSAR